MVLFTGIPTTVAKSKQNPWQPRGQMTRVQCNWPGMQENCHLQLHPNYKSTNYWLKQRHGLMLWLDDQSKNLANPQYLKLHATMQQNFCYYVKHTAGASTEYNQHSTTNPWYGAGQGVGDACLWWVVQGNSLILVYKLKATAWMIYSPNYQNYHKQVIDAFIWWYQPDQWSTKPPNVCQTNPNSATQFWPMA